MNDNSDQVVALQSITQKITVIMPAYNAAPYLNQAIDSILAQSFTDFALVVVDDHSSDDTWDIINAYDDSRLVALRNTSNEGHLRIRNRVFRYSPSPYITYLDADDWCTQDRLELQHDFLENNPHIHMCGCFVTNVFTNVEKVRKYPQSHQAIERNLAQGSTANYCSASVMFRHSVLDTVGYYDELFVDIGSADIDWQTRVTETLETINLPLRLYYYRQHEQSYSKQQQHRFSHLSSDIAYLLHRLRQLGISYDKESVFSFLDAQYPELASDMSGKTCRRHNPLALMLYRLTPAMVRDYVVSRRRRRKVESWLQAFR